MEAETVYALSQLQNTQNFKAGALAHILEGELNGAKKAVGFHYEGMPTSEFKELLLLWMKAKADFLKKT